MAPSLLLSCLLIGSLVSGSIAFDVTKILNQYSDYAVFNQELSNTNVAEEINNRKSVTVLVVPNGAMSAVTSLKDDKLENVMRVHVILDYYDSAKVKKLKNGTTVTTLYQTTGSADKKAGFVKISKDDNEIKVGSAVSGAQISAKVNKVVTSVPSDISVIEISSPIVPPGLDGSSSSPDSSPSKDSSPSGSPSPSSSDSQEADSDDSSSDSDDAPAPSPKKHAPPPSHKKHDKHKHAHASAPSPSDDSDGDGADADADADSDADSGSKDDADAADEDEDERSEDDEDSGASRNVVVSSVMLLASVFATL